MSEKRAGGIFASSFVAGLLLAAAIFAPRAWEPVPGPYFGLDAPASMASPETEGIEAAHAELSARAQANGANTVNRSSIDRPMALQPHQPDRSAGRPSSNIELADSVASHTRAPLAAGAFTTVPAAGVDAPPSTPLPSVAHSASPVALPPERVANADASSPAATAAIASTLPSLPTPSSPAASSSPAAPTSAAQDEGNPPPNVVTQAVQPPEPPESLKGLMNRLQASQPTVLQQSPQHVQQPIQSDVRMSTPIATVSESHSSSQSLAHAPAPIPAQSSPLTVDPYRPAASAPRSLPLPVSAGTVGAVPLPGEPWTDPDGVNWSDVVASPRLSTTGGERRRTWLGEWRNDTRGTLPRTDESQGSANANTSRLLDRLRGGDRRQAQAPVPDAGGNAPADASPPDISQWPRAVKLEQQLDHLAALAAGTEPIDLWANQTRAAIQSVQDTRGPRDAAADSSLIALGEAVIAGMSLADTTIDGSLATHTRRAALAVARRVAVWRSTAAFFAAIDRNPQEVSINDAAAAMTRQAAGRTVVEIARLLDGIERFEMTTSSTDALTVKTSLGSICGFYPTAARAVARAVEDHYLAPNVRIAVHQQFLETLLPGASVDTAPFQDTVMGREVRGTRTVERTTILRLVPDDDEICFNLEVHGDIASRAITDAGPVSVTARSASAFTVRKPITISPQGLLFGNATGVASNRSHVDTIQTSFDAVPVMGSLVRNMARNQQAEAMPEANREVIDKIISRACREVDTQAEPEFAKMADRIRDRVWMPLVKLGLDPKAVAMQTTPSVATMRLRLAGDTQLAAHTPRPRVATDAMLSLQLHESSANNALDRLGVAGKRLTLEELIQLICDQVGVESKIPEELPEGVSVTFAKKQPIRVECRDGLVHVHVALDAIESGRRDWYDIIARVAYKPVCSGQQVFLEREGPIQLSGKGHEGRMELALRTIFGKIFPKERPIAVLPEQIAKNPKLADVQAAQAVSSDGWFALTLQQRTTPPPAIASPPKPQQARPAEARRKAVWR